LAQTPVIMGMESTTTVDPSNFSDDNILRLAE
jgi:hypothetical protein